MSVSVNEESILDAAEGIDVMWLTITGCLVFLMQCGFALIEGGAVRSKSVSSVLLKNFVDGFVSTITFWLWGYALAFGGEGEPNPNSFLGTKYFALVDMPTKDYALFFFQWTFVSTCGTIVSGAVAERLQYSRYNTCCFFLGGWIYPIVVHAAWSTNGWLSPFNDGSLAGKIGPANRGVYDFAGSGVIHAVGGTAALVAAKAVGPRNGRFDENGDAVPLPGHSAMMSVLGTLFLLFSWYGFNAGSTLTLANGGGAIAARTTVTTSLAVASAAICVIFTRFIFSKCSLWDLEVSLNGSLAGAVAVSGCCAVIEPWAAVILGVLAGWTYLTASFVILHIAHIDDPVDAGAVHCFCGCLGLVFTGFFASPNAITETYGFDDTTYAGVFMGGNGIQLGYQLLFMVFCVLWSGISMAIILAAFYFTFGVRVSEEDEKMGLDEAFHGLMAYDYLETVYEMARLKNELIVLTKALADHAHCDHIGLDAFRIERQNNEDPAMLLDARNNQRERERERQQRLAEEQDMHEVDG